MKTVNKGQSIKSMGQRRLLQLRLSLSKIVTHVHAPARRIPCSRDLNIIKLGVGIDI